MHVQAQCTTLLLNGAQSLSQLPSPCVLLEFSLIFFDCTDSIDFCQQLIQLSSALTNNRTWLCASLEHLMRCHKHFTVELMSVCFLRSLTFAPAHFSTSQSSRHIRPLVDLCFAVTKLPCMRSQTAALRIIHSIFTKTELWSKGRLETNEDPLFGNSLFPSLLHNSCLQALHRSSRR